MGGLSNIQIIFIISASVIGALIIFLFIAIPVVHIYHKRQFKHYYYKKIYHIALYNDYYLVNDFVFKLDSKHNTVVDHLLFGNKFIYVLQDYYFEGDLTGSASDPDLVLISKTGDKNYVDNPYATFNKLLSRLSTATGINTDLMVGIAVVNNDCRMKINTPSKQFFMIQRNKLPKLIKTIENRDIGNINAEKLQDAVLTVNKLNRKDLLK